jgi:hypothetical protein
VVQARISRRPRRAYLPAAPIHLPRCSVGPDSVSLYQSTDRVLTIGLGVVHTVILMVDESKDRPVNNWRSAAARVDALTNGQNSAP